MVRVNGIKIDFLVLYVHTVHDTYINIEYIE